MTFEICKNSSQNAAILSLAVFVSLTSWTRPLHLWHRCVLRPEPNFLLVVIFEAEPPAKQPRDKFEITNSTLMLADAFVSMEHNHMKPANGSVCIFSAFSCQPASSLGSPLSFKEGEGVRVKWGLQHVLIFVTVPTPSLKKRITKVGFIRAPHLFLFLVMLRWWCCICFRFSCFLALLALLLFVFGLSLVWLSGFRCVHVLSSDGYRFENWLGVPSRFF